MVSLGAQLPLDEAREQMQGTRAKSFTVTTSMPPRTLKHILLKSMAKNIKLTDNVACQRNWIRWPQWGLMESLSEKLDQMTPTRANGKLHLIKYNMNRSLVHPLHRVSFESKRMEKQTVV